MASGFGVERSMWQRQTQRCAFPGTWADAGRLRVVDDDHVPAPDSSAAFISL